MAAVAAAWVAWAVWICNYPSKGSCDQERADFGPLFFLCQNGGRQIGMFSIKSERRGYVLWMVLVTASAAAEPVLAQTINAPVIKAGDTWTY